jgi:threonine/homoserine/homoserine lactone efflux protein
LQVKGKKRKIMTLWVLAGLASTSFLVALSGALMPGPLLTVTVGEAARRGFWAGPLIMVGHALLELALVLVLLIGLGAWLNKPLILGVVGVLGAGMLGWMGFMTLKASRRGRLDFEAQDNSGLNPVLSGVLMSAANPYWLLWWLTIGLGYVMFSVKYGMAGVALFYLGHIAADFAWYSLVSGAVAGGRRFLSDGLYRGFLAGCGVFLVGFGGYFAVQGVKFLMNS